MLNQYAGKEWKKNFTIFDFQLSAEDMESIKSLDMKGSNFLIIVSLK